jgi:hypothetical protein
MALRRTIDERPDLIAARGGISEEEQLLLDSEDGTVPAHARPASEAPADDPAGEPPGP